MPWREPPVVDFEHEPQFQWPFWHVGCREDDLFGDLHQRFNTTPYPAYIQDPESFHKDVVEIACKAHGRVDFFRRMQQRRDDRFAELDGFRHRLFLLHENGFTRLSPEQSFCLFRLDFCPTLDSLVALYASLLAPHESGEEPSLDFFPLPRQRATLGQKETRPCHRPSQMLTGTDDPARPATSPTATRQPPAPSCLDAHDGEPHPCSSKRKASHHRIDCDQGHGAAKRQRIGGDKQPSTPPTSDATAVHLEAKPSSLVSSRDKPKRGAAPTKVPPRGARASAPNTKSVATARGGSARRSATRHRQTSRPDACSSPRRSRRIAVRRHRLQRD